MKESRHKILSSGKTYLLSIAVFSCLFIFTNGKGRNVITFSVFIQAIVSYVLIADNWLSFVRVDFDKYLFTLPKRITSVITQDVFSLVLSQIYIWLIGLLLLFISFLLQSDDGTAAFNGFSCRFVSMWAGNMMANITYVSLITYSVVLLMPNQAGHVVSFFVIISLIFISRIAAHMEASVPLLFLSDLWGQNTTLKYYESSAIMPFAINRVLCFLMYYGCFTVAGFIYSRRRCL